MAKYSVYFMCNECLEVHPMGTILHLDDGPPDKASIGDTYKGKELPTTVATLMDNMVTCPNTGRLTAQRDNKQVFLVPGVRPWRRRLSRQRRAMSRWKVAEHFKVLIGGNTYIDCPT
jgi:hypothetical protein